MKYILVFGLGLSLIFVYDEKIGDLPYFVLFVCLFLNICCFLIRFFQEKKIGFVLNYSINGFSSIDRLLSSTLIWLWYLILTSWVIGVSIGLVNGANPSFVFRNFFGLVVYMVFPVMLIVLPSARSLIIMIYTVGIIQMCYALVNSYEFVINPLSFFIQSSISEWRTFYLSGIIVIFPLFTVGLAHQLFPKQYLSNNYGQMVTTLSNSVFFTMLTLIFLIMPSFSKGFILATVILFLGVLYISINYSIKTGTIRTNMIILIILLSVILYILPSSFYDIVINSYSSNEGSNIVRADQVKHLVSEFTFWGNGLGSLLRSGYMRDDMGYGFELTYLNIILKLGIFSIFLFLAYIVTLMIAFIRIVRKVYIFESLFCIGLMGYLIPGIGNPTLLSVSAVIVHCISMYIIVKPFLSPLR